uniref:Uncharacterized protein n=1 Tax=Bionectria ochroleuca TaxID=29856 RepID=A0A8H7K6C7_BIOOC
MRKIIGNPTTELAYITVKEGLERDALDESTPAGQAFAYMVDMVIKARPAPAGCTGGHLSRTQGRSGSWSLGTTSRIISTTARLKPLPKSRAGFLLMSTSQPATRSAMSTPRDSSVQHLRLQRGRDPLPVLPQ